MGTTWRWSVIVLMCLAGLAGVGCSSHDDDDHPHHQRDRWDDRRDSDRDDYHRGPRGEVGR